MKEKTDDILRNSSLKENPFGVPAEYFSTMQQEVMEKISAIPHQQIEETDTSVPATFMTYLKPALSLASVFGIIIGMGYGAMKLTDIMGKSDAAAEIPAHIAENTPTQEMQDDYLASILDLTIDDLFDANYAAEGAVDIVSPEIDNETIEQYLIDTRVSASSIALLE